MQVHEIPFETSRTRAIPDSRQVDQEVHSPTSMTGPSSPLGRSVRRVRTTDALATTPLSGSTARGRATRERIVAAASRLVYARGVEGTTLDDVRAATGVSKSQLYHYFTDKADLVRAVVAWQGAAVLAAQQPELEAIDSLAALQRWRDKVVALQEEHRGGLGCPLGMLVAQLAHDDLARRALGSAFAAWHEGLRRGLAVMQERGELGGSADLDALAWGLLAAIQGGLVLAQAARSLHPVEVALDVALAQVRAARGDW